MKKLALTFAIVLTMGLGAYAQGSGLLGFGPDPDGEPARTTPMISLPGTHGGSDDVDGEDTPLAGGIAVLAGLGAAYLVAKKRREE